MNLKLMGALRQISTVKNEIKNRPDIKEFIKGIDKLSDIFALPNQLSYERIEKYRRAYFGIGNTGYYKINLPNDNRLFLKMEYANAMGNNHYSRFWIVHLFICEVLGLIEPNSSEILEVTSGSSGIALSYACEMLDFKVTILVPEMLPENRILPMMKANTTIIKVQGYVNNCVDKLRELLESGDYFITNHSEEKADIITHVFSRIGLEMIRDIPKPIDYAILAMGNGTSTLAMSKALKQENPNIHITAYRPNFEENPNDIIFGLIAANVECRHIPLSMQFVDDLKFTTDINLDYIRYKYRFDTEIKNLGYSSLYGIAIAYEMAKSTRNKTFVTIGYDKIDRY